VSPRKLRGDSITYWTERLPDGRIVTLSEVVIDGEPAPEPLVRNHAPVRGRLLDGRPEENPTVRTP
jgi:hypothetical protein